MRRALAFIERDALGDQVRPGILIEDQIEPARGGPPDRTGAAGGDPERRMRLLRRRRLDHDIVEPPETAAMGEPAAHRPGPDHHFERLVKTRLGLLGCDLKASELAMAIAFADAEIETPPGNQIERRRLFREQYRIVPRQHHDRRAEPQSRGAHGKRGQKHQRRRDLVPAAEMMLDRKARDEAEPLRSDIEIEIVAKALPRLRIEIAAMCLRRREQTEFHDAYE